MITVGLVYDLKEDYNLKNISDFNDFSTLIEIENVKSKLEESGFKVLCIGNHLKLLGFLTKKEKPFDIIFNMLEGITSRNREGLVPAICEAFNIKYIGTDAFGMSITLNKHQTKLFANDLNISIAKDLLFDFSIYKIDQLEELLKLKKLKFPILIKPNREGTSMGISMINNILDAKAHIQKLFNIYNEEILCEEYIEGNEVSVPIVEINKKPKALGIVEFNDLKDNKIGLFTFNKKQNKEYKQKLTSLDKEIQNKIIEYSLLIYKALKLKSFARIDWIVKNNIPIFLEATPLPNMENDSVFEFLAKQKGTSFSKILKDIIYTELNIKQ